MPAHQTNTQRRPLQMTNTRTNLSLWNMAPHVIQHAPAVKAFLPLLESQVSGLVPALIWKSVIWLLRHEHMREQVPVKLKSGEVFRSVEGNAEEPTPPSCAADGRLRLYGMRAAGELRQPPVRSPQGIRYQRLDNDIWTFCSRLLWGEETGLVWWSQGFLMLAVLSDDAVLCHYCAPALIIDSIKMAVKLDVPISSGACCLFWEDGMLSHRSIIKAFRR